MLSLRAGFNCTLACGLKPDVSLVVVTFASSDQSCIQSRVKMYSPGIHVSAVPELGVLNLCYWYLEQ